MINETSHNIEWEKISKYLNGEMSIEERIAFEKLIDSNSEYAQIVAASEKDLDLIDELKEIETNFNADNAWTSVKSKISKRDYNQSNNSIKANFTFKKVLQLAAMIVIVIGLGLASFSAYNKYMSSYKSYALEMNSNSQSITLPDGSIVTLNGGAELKYPIGFTKEKRQVYLSGEAFFDIVKNPKKPFIIIAEGAEIKVLGTSFNVIANNSKVEVLVESGKVQFSGIKNPTNSLILEKGDFGILSENSIEKTVIRDDNYLSWKTHKMIFKEMQLKDVAKVIERTYQVSIKFENDSIAKNPINTAYDNDPLNRVLDNICLTYNLTYEKNGSQIVIKSRN